MLHEGFTVSECFNPFSSVIKEVVCTVNNPHICAPLYFPMLNKFSL